MNFGGVYIKMGDGKISFAQASQTCSDHGGYLSKMNNPKEISALKQIMGKKNNLFKYCRAEIFQNPQNREPFLAKDL